MYFKNLKLQNFRNIENCSLKFSQGVNIFLGKNGQGKTNLIEAIYYLINGSSFRYAESKGLIQFNKPLATADAEVFQNDLVHSIKSVISQNQNQTVLNKKKSRQKEITKLFSCIIFSPESLAAIKEGAEFRRDLIDELIANTNKNNIDLLYEFKKVLRTRNKVLKDFKEERTSKNETIAVLESLNPIFLDYSIELTHQRIYHLKQLVPFFKRSIQQIIKQPSVDISVEYVVSGENRIENDYENLSNAIRQRALELSEKELFAGVSLVGPQKHDILFIYNEKDSRFYCSQGQQRAIILAFKIAQTIYHKKMYSSYPVLLLDDVFSELDFEKRNALVEFLKEIDTQTFLTTTELDLSKIFKSPSLCVFEINNGNISHTS